MIVVHKMVHEMNYHQIAVKDIRALITNEQDPGFYNLVSILSLTLNSIGAKAALHHIMDDPSITPHEGLKQYLHKVYMQQGYQMTLLRNYISSQVFEFGPGGSEAFRINHKDFYKVISQFPSLKKQFHLLVLNGFCANPTSSLSGYLFQFDNQNKNIPLTKDDINFYLHDIIKNGGLIKYMQQLPFELATQKLAFIIRCYGLDKISEFCCTVEIKQFTVEFIFDTASSLFSFRIKSNHTAIKTLFGQGGVLEKIVSKFDNCKSESDYRILFEFLDEYRGYIKNSMIKKIIGRMNKVSQDKSKYTNLITGFQSFNNRKNNLNIYYDVANSKFSYLR